MADITINTKNEDPKKKEGTPKKDSTWHMK
jgi:hypothetical protein